MCPAAKNRHTASGENTVFPLLRKVAGAMLRRAVPAIAPCQAKSLRFLCLRVL
jgi:hypothetical protein